MRNGCQACITTRGGVQDTENMYILLNKQVVRRNIGQMAYRVELEYRLFLSIDSSLYRPKTIFFRGCAKCRPLAFFLNPIWPPTHPNIIKLAITP